MASRKGKIGTAVIAVGGNALIVDESHQALPDQARAAENTVHHIMELIVSGWNVVMTHGNGPQVGFILRRSEIALGEVPSVPIEYADADTQGADLDAHDLRGYGPLNALLAIWQGTELSSLTNKAPRVLAAAAYVRALARIQDRVAAAKPPTKQMLGALEKASNSARSAGVAGLPLRVEAALDSQHRIRTEVRERLERVFETLAD